MIRISAEPIDPSALLDEFHRTVRAGATAVFVGTVRADDGVVALTLEHYPGFTEREIEAMTAGVSSRHGLSGAMVVHRVGRMTPGDPIVFAATASDHRRAAMSGLEELVDRLKTEAPLWKKEETAHGMRWVEPVASDRQAVDQWKERA
ncbi:molybdenum cofactor biosynthesis protein MoaE [Sphingomonas jaspsi]|uniref:molybdenum cofactor biosynthesis protein MoaE n=1 Tax=Sphingomonas jaspsi TaxID=392409 RepID=UPI0004B62A54|nr:molybdenum cofactor biosynthesis protein MoaE [Sphingomonas jaspsi]